MDEITGKIALSSITSLSVLGQNEIISTLAGASQGFGGDNGPATSAQLYLPQGVATDSAGNVYIADQQNNRIRKVTRGVITTVAGNGTFGGGGDNGPAVNAQLTGPNCVAVDAGGNIYIADSYLIANAYVAGRIHKVSGGAITTIAGVAGNGTLGFSGDNGPATSAQLGRVYGIAVDSGGNLYIADWDNNRVRKVSNGVITTVAGNGTLGFSGDNGPATGAELENPHGVALDAGGNLYIADFNNGRVRKVANGVITTVAGGGSRAPGAPLGDNGPATSAELEFPEGIAVDSAGNLYIAEDNERIREVESGVITTVAGNGVQGFSGDNGAATSAELSGPAGVAVDSADNVYIADSYNNRVRLLTPNTASPAITPEGIVSVFSTAPFIQPGSWVSIYGSNLASSSATWNGNFPTSLGGTSVTINGKSAYLWFVSRTQINLQVPSDTATGSVPVTVTTESGTAISSVTLVSFAPSFSLLDNKHVTGIILRSNGSGSQGGGTYDILGPVGSSLGYATVAAKTGDTVELFAVGLGPTNPIAPVGQVFSGAAPTTYSVNLLINNVNVIPTFAGLSSAGLYQINLTIPAGVGTGDLPLVATVGGTQTQSGVVISIQ